MSSDSLLPIPGNVDAIWAQHKALTNASQRLQSCAECVRGVRLEEWSGQAADDAADLRARLTREILRAADATEDAAEATARYAVTLAEAQHRRKMLVLALAGDPARLLIANEDVTRWLDQVRSESTDSSNKINAAKAELSAVSTVFRDLPAGPVPHAFPIHRHPSAPSRPQKRRKDSSPYAAAENQTEYTQLMAELNQSVAEGHDMIAPIRGVASWAEWQQGPGRDIGRLT